MRFLQTYLAFTLRNSVYSVVKDFEWFENKKGEKQ